MRAWLRARKSWSPVPSTSSSRRMSGVTAVAIEKPQAGAQAGRVGAGTGASMNGPDVGELDDRRGEVGGSRPAVDPQERGSEGDVVAPGDLHLEPGAEGEERRDAPADVDLALPDGWRIPASARRRVLLPAPFGPMIASNSPWSSGEADVAKGPEVGGSESCRRPKHLGERALERRPPGEAQVVADAKVAEHRPRYGLVAGCSLTGFCAKAGSTRLKRGDREQRRGSSRPSAGPEREGSPAASRGSTPTVPR